MNIILLSGGLGNQMFQYAFGLSIKIKGGNVIFNDYLIKKDHQHNGFELTNVFDIYLDNHKLINLATKIIRKLEIFKTNLISKLIKKTLYLFGIRLCKEKYNSVYNEIYLQPKKYWNFAWGFWQSERYFKSNEKEIRQIFTFNLELINPRTKKIAQEMKKVESVSLHVRRGDYLSPDSPYAGICSLQYYQQAINIIKEKTIKPHFYIFSDDIEWVKQHLPITNAHYIDWNKKEQSWQDMFLMSNCQHNIIANSSFSWWGAWLNPNKNKIVITPEHFLNTEKTPDITPKEWIKIKER